MFDLSTFISLEVHGGSLAPGMADLVNLIVVFFEGLTSQSVSEIFLVLIPGVNSLPNIHPLIIHFPIVLFPTFFIVDIIGRLTKNKELRTMASGLLYLGAISSVFTVIAGFQAASNIPHGLEVHSILEKHKWYGLFVALLGLVLSVWRFRTKLLFCKEADVFHFISSAFLCTALMLGADLGGLMVYKFGIGVEAVSPAANNVLHAHGQDNK